MGDTAPSGKTLLVVEDNDISGEGLAVVLRRAGYRAVPAGEEWRDRGRVAELAALEWRSWALPPLLGLDGGGLLLGLGLWLWRRRRRAPWPTPIASSSCSALTSPRPCGAGTGPPVSSETARYHHALVLGPHPPAAVPRPGRHRGGSGLLLDEELARAVRHESAAAVMYWWRASHGAVMRTPAPAPPAWPGARGWRSGTCCGRSAWRPG
jgi:LPXTG-motif cell wall-anchored protein